MTRNWSSARVGQIITDYPDLDYLLCFQSESIFAGQSALQGVAQRL